MKYMSNEKPDLKIVVASSSVIKIEGCSKPFADIAGVNIQSVAAPSGVNAQPMSYNETEKGARNRLVFARAATPGAVLYLSVENGLMKEGQSYLDRAIVIVSDDAGHEATAQSAPVKIPTQWVKKMLERGAKDCTVGQVMAEAGVIANAYDPHLGLTDKSRADYIGETVQRAVRNLGENRGTVWQKKF
jgi:non-canonical (house-cleaning) NTP pyrophosphatase